MQIRQIDWLELTEKLFVLGTLYFATGTLNAMLIGALEIEIDTTYLNIPAVASGPAKAPIFLVIQFGILALTLLFMGLRWRRFVAVILRPWLIWAYVLLAVLSCMWTPTPIDSLKRVLFFFATTLFSMYFAGRFSVRQQMLMVASALSMSAFSHLTFGFLFPAYAQHVMYWAGAWRGLMTHKNSLAQLSVLGALIIQLVLPWKYRYKKWLVAGLLGCVLLVLLSTSKTGLVLLLLLSLLLPLLRSLRINRIEAKLAIITVFLLILTVVVAFVSNYELILTSLGRDPTLTGRTDIWAVLLDKASRRLWLGYGFEVFWSGGMSGEAADLWYVNRYIVDTAHNGFLDILLELGVVGLTIFLASVGMNVLRGLQWLVHRRSPEGLYPLMVMFYWVVYNLSESTVPTPFSINWVLFVSVSTSMLIYRLPASRPIAHNRPQVESVATYPGVAYEALPAHPDS